MDSQNNNNAKDIMKKQRIYNCNKRNGTVVSVRASGYLYTHIIIEGSS